RKIGTSSRSVRVQPGCGPPLDGWRSTHKQASRRNAKFDVKCAVASNLIVRGRLLLQIVGSSFLQVWTEPFVQRCCCDLKPFISTGNSAGVTKSLRKKNCQPPSCAR